MAQKHPKRPRDINQWAKHIVDEATGQVASSQPSPEGGKNAAAVELGRRGGLKGGRARAGKLSPNERRQIADEAKEIFNRVEAPNAELARLAELFEVVYSQTIDKDEAFVFFIDPTPPKTGADPNAQAATPPDPDGKPDGQGSARPKRGDGGGAAGAGKPAQTPPAGGSGGA